jgi:2-polyprenyl-3-methyl-5-hydroxy-6-metoxy-1,4-benzoquinol methylase
MTSPETRHFDEVWRTKIARPAAGGNLRADKAVETLGGGRRLLDVGCGDGALACRLADRFEEVHGVDIAPRAIELAVRAGVNAKVVDLNREALPYPDGYFDALTSLSVLQYVADLDRALVECRRVLAPGGVLLVSIPNMRAIWRLFKLGVLGTFPRTSIDTSAGIDGGALHYFCSRDFSKLLERCGFRVVSSTGIFCLPSLVERMTDRGPAGAIKRELFSGETLFRAMVLRC